MSEELDGTLGREVRALRTAQNLSQARLAQMAEVSRRHLAALERGANVSIFVVLKVARALGAKDLPLGSLRLHNEDVSPLPRVQEALETLSRIETLAREARVALEGGGKSSRARRATSNRTPR